MKIQVLFGIILATAFSTVDAAAPCRENCAEFLNKCQPLSSDFKSPNRFLRCGGKDNSKNVKEEGASVACHKALHSFLEAVVAAEKKGNHCNAKEECLLVANGGIPYHINRSLEPQTTYALQRIRARLSEACPRPQDNWAELISLEDQVYPTHYTCEKHICVPQYSGKAARWDWEMDAILKERGPYREK